MLRFSRIMRQSLITQADRARQARRWDIAARYYRKSLDRLGVKVRWATILH